MCCVCKATYDIKNACEALAVTKCCYEVACNEIWSKVLNVYADFVAIYVGPGMSWDSHDHSLPLDAGLVVIYVGPGMSWDSQAHSGVAS